MKLLIVLGLINVGLAIFNFGVADLGPNVHLLNVGAGVFNLLVAGFAFSAAFIVRD